MRSLAGDMGMTTVIMPSARGMAPHRFVCISFSLNLQRALSNFQGRGNGRLMHTGLRLAFFSYVRKGQ